MRRHRSYVHLHLCFVASESSSNAWFILPALPRVSERSRGSTACKPSPERPPCAAPLSLCPTCRIKPSGAPPPNRPGGPRRSSCAPWRLQQKQPCQPAPSFRRQTPRFLPGARMPLSAQQPVPHARLRKRRTAARPGHFRSLNQPSSRVSREGDVRPTLESELEIHPSGRKAIQRISLYRRRRLSKRL